MRTGSSYSGPGPARALGEEGMTTPPTWPGTSLGVQDSTLPSAGGLRSIPGWGARFRGPQQRSKTPHAAAKAQGHQINKQENETKNLSTPCPRALFLIPAQSHGIRAQPLSCTVPQPGHLRARRPDDRALQPVVKPRLTSESLGPPGLARAGGGNGSAQGCWALPTTKGPRPRGSGSPD